MSQRTEGRVPEGSPRAVFGAMLRHYRTAAGLTQDELAAKVHVSGKLISAYENGRRVPTRPTTADIDALAELGTSGALIALWDQFERAMRYQAYPDWFQEWPEAEATAQRLRWYEPIVIPGLLQTADYARAIFQTRFGATEDEVEERVTARLRRQEILARQRPPLLWVILDEFVLRRPVGGRCVMQEQVARLVEAARRPKVRIEVIPAQTGAHIGTNGHFVIADFEDQPSVGYQDAAVRGQALRDQKDVAVLAATWDTLTGDALPRGASLALLEEAAKSWTSPA